MHEILILPVDFKAANSLPTSDGREGLKLLVNKVREGTVGKKNPILRLNWENYVTLSCVSGDLYFPLETHNICFEIDVLRVMALEILQMVNHRLAETCHIHILTSTQVDTSTQVPTSQKTIVLAMTSKWAAFFSPYVFPSPVSHSLSFFHSHILVITDACCLSTHINPRQCVRLLYFSFPIHRVTISSSYITIR